jgi:esterase/lipase superfamily enzyme
MIYVVTNRNIQKGKTNHEMFGDEFNKKDSSELRIAEAKWNSQSEWNLELKKETSKVKPPIKNVLKIISDDDKPCVMFTHGFNQNLENNLNKCKEIEAFGVNVLAFSWPSNPGPPTFLGKYHEYKNARQNARRSAIALERFFDKVCGYANETGSSKNLDAILFHSMGNYLLQSFAINPDYDNQLSIFKNIILHQADVDSLHHEKWTDLLSQNSRLIITINESDDTLDISDIINPDRLGNTAWNTNSKIARYFDFTNATHADDEHRLWADDVAGNNKNIKIFFKQAFHGKNVSRKGMAFNPDTGCFELG